MADPQAKVVQGELPASRHYSAHTVALGSVAEGDWDCAVLAWYPRRAAFVDMMTSPEYYGWLGEEEAPLQHGEMTEVRPSQLELMQIHIEALYVHDDRSRIRCTNEWEGKPAPRFLLGRTIAGNLWRFRTDLPDDLVLELEDLCNAEPVVTELSRTPLHQEEFVRLLEAHMPTERIWTGPAYWFSRDVVPNAGPVEISDANAHFLRGGLEDWLEDVPHRRPFKGIIEDGHAVSICASVRITNAAHEAGVETLPAFRRKGHAVNVVAGWADTVRKIGAVPLYSTSWDNTASRNVAARLGLSMFGVDFHVT